MFLFGLMDLLADDWVQSRQESARKFGTKPSRIATWFAGRKAGAATKAPSTPLAAPSRAGESKRAA